MAPAAGPGPRSPCDRIELHAGEVLVQSCPTIKNDHAIKKLRQAKRPWAFKKPTHGEGGRGHDHLVYIRPRFDSDGSV